MMKEYNLSIPWMYFTGIEAGEITVLFFDKIPFSLDKIKSGDLLKISIFDSCQKMYFDHSEIIPFKEVDNDLAKKAGFATKELLSSHLMERFDMLKYSLSKESKIDNELFYVIYLVNDPEEITFSDGECSCKVDYDDNVISTYLNNKYVKEWKKKNKVCPYTMNTLQYNKDFYNPEYDDKPWS